MFCMLSNVCLCRAVPLVPSHDRPPLGPAQGDQDTALWAGAEDHGRHDGACVTQQVSCRSLAVSMCADACPTRCGREPAGGRIGWCSRVSHPSMTGWQRGSPWICITSSSPKIPGRRMPSHQSRGPCPNLMLMPTRTTLPRLLLRPAGHVCLRAPHVPMLLVCLAVLVWKRNMSVCVWVCLCARLFLEGCGKICMAGREAGARGMDC